MATALRDSYGPDVPRRLAGMLAAVQPAFPRQRFLRRTLDGYAALSLTARARRMSDALRATLPDDYVEALAILLASVGPPLAKTRDNGLAPFLYLPHVYFVADHGLDHFEASMHAQHVLTQRFTAEFSIRPFLVRHRDATLARLREWTGDPSEHVRRLVSEGTRPRLPWAARLPEFQRDPRPVLGLLEALRDDPSPYVRRSVANNLNDIGKDHPALLAETAGRWSRGASPARAWIVRHALRTAVKRGERAALAVVGYAAQARVALEAARILPLRPAIGQAVSITFTLRSTAARSQRLLVDLRVHYKRAGGRTHAHVFKLKTLTLPAGGRIDFHKRLSLADLSTRRHHPGNHAVEALVNGRPLELGVFQLRAGVR